MDSQSNQPHTLCNKCNNFIRTQNFLIHEARCKGPTSSQSRQSSRIFNNSRPPTRSGQSTIFNQRPEQQQRIPCPFCGYGQTLKQLDTHPNNCQHREQQCQRCRNRFPRSLMQQHVMFCPSNRQQQFQDFQMNNDPRNFRQPQQFYQNQGRGQFLPYPQQGPPQFYENYPPQRREQRSPLSFIDQMMNQLMAPMRRAQSMPMRQPEGRRVIAFNDLGALIQFLAGHGMHQQQIGLNKQEINKFPVTKYKSNNKKQSEEEGEKCIICYCNFQEGQNCMTLPCKHIFHPQCVGTWLQKNPTCPVCKHNFGPPRQQQQGHHSHGPHMRVIRFGF